MLHINNNTKMNFLLEALPSWQLEANASARIGDIIDAAIEVANKDWPNAFNSWPARNYWTPEKIGDLTIKEFETFLVEQIGDDEEEYHLDNEVRFEAFADILKVNTFRETIVNA